MLSRRSLVYLALLLSLCTFARGFAAHAVDINHASVEELMQLPGMTLVWAQRVVRFRPYRSKLELLNHGVLSEAVYRQVRDSIVAHREPNSLSK